MHYWLQHSSCSQKTAWASGQLLLCVLTKSCCTIAECTAAELKAYNWSICECINHRHVPNAQSFAQYWLTLSAANGTWLLHTEEHSLLSTAAAVASGTVAGGCLWYTTRPLTKYSKHAYGGTHGRHHHQRSFVPGSYGVRAARLTAHKYNAIGHATCTRCHAEDTASCQRCRRLVIVYRCYLTMTANDTKTSGYMCDGESHFTNRLQEERSPAVHAKYAAHKQSYESHYRLLVCRKI
eukprot:21231-Heterococcus_DN1.PRE.8